MTGQESTGSPAEVTKQSNDEALPLRFHQTLVFFSVWHEVSKQKGISNIIVLSALSALLSGPFLLSAYLGFAINNIIYTKNIDLLFSLSVVVFVLVFLGGLAEFYTNKIAAQINSRICHQLVSHSWYQLILMPSVTFGKFKQNELTSVLMDTMETLQKHQLFVIQNTLRSLFVVAFTVVILSYYHITFLFLVSFFVVITCAVPIYVAKNAQTYIQQEPDRLAAMNGFVSSVLGLQLFLRFSNLKGVTNKFNQLLLELSVTQAGKWLIWNCSFNLKVTLNLLSHVCVLWLGGLLFLRGSIDLTELVVVYVLTSMVIPRLDNIYKIYNYSQSLNVCYEKLKPFSDDVVLLPSQQKQETEYKSIQSLRLNQASFRYPLANELAISDLDLTFEKGNSYLISGESGVGKSTLIDLLSGIIHPTSGYFEVNGDPLLLDCVKRF
jgi:ABC-type bacteriocin/lantibiotic exporter with double-glycine peptidase domain